MRLVFFTAFVALLFGCAKSSDPIDRIVSELSATQGMWVNGLSPNLTLSQTASPEEVTRKLFGDAAHCKILEVRQVHIPPGERGSDLYTAVSVQTDTAWKIVIIRYFEHVGWWTHDYDVKPSA